MENDRMLKKAAAGADNIVWALATMVIERNAARNKARETEEVVADLKAEIAAAGAEEERLAGELNAAAHRIAELEARLRDAAARARGDIPGAEPPRCPTPGPCSCPAPTPVQRHDIDGRVWYAAFHAADDDNLGASWTAFDKCGFMIVRKPGNE